MTLTDEGRRVAERPAFPTEIAVPPVGVPDPPHGVMPSYPAQPPRAFSTGMTIHEHATLELLAARFSEAGNPETKPVAFWDVDGNVTDAVRWADAYCNALGARETNA
jgi:hypothetical protein